jgi:putative DNA primase/helicase
MGANLENIRFVTQTTIDGKPRPFCPATDMPALAAHAKAIGQVDLLEIDPVVAAIGAKVDSHKNSETRIGLQPVVDFAIATKCAVLGVTHFTKGTAGQDPVERVTGSLAFGALPRIVWAAAKGKEGRILVRAKTNLGVEGGGFRFDIDVAPLMERPDIIATRIAWLGALEGTAKELLDEAEPKDEKENKQDMAENFLKLRLKPGDKVPAKEIEEEATACGIHVRTLRRAQAAAGVKSEKTKDKWWWTRD